MNRVSDTASIAGIKYVYESGSCTTITSSATDTQLIENLPTIQSKFVSVKRSSKKQKKLFIFTIVSIIILILIVIILTAIILFKSNNTTNQISTSTTNFNNPTEPTTATTTIIYEIGNGGSSGDPPCSSYTVLNDPSRNVNKSGIGGACDSGPFFNTSIGGRWIRFEGIGGTVLPSTSPGTKHCGAYLAGWSNVTLPSTTNTLVNGTLCFESVISICGFTLPMSVINCGLFYVYFLSPVNFCNARYCTV